MGAATAELNVAGGGRGVMNYAKGAWQTAAICDEFSAAYGEGRCADIQFDVGVTPEAAQQNNE